MEQIMKTMESAYNVLYEIHVARDDVERMAQARAQLREAYARLDERAKKDRETMKQLTGEVNDLRQAMNLRAKSEEANHADGR